jgi:MYXO-CTERM domain-containing protein
MGVCDSATGQCGVQPRSDGVACSDGNMCTRVKQCMNGACGGLPVDCKPDECHTARPCDVHLGCVFDPVPDGTRCSMGACASGKCTPVAPPAPTDAGVDAAAVDAGRAADAGAGPALSPGGSGCSCEAAGTARGSGALALFGLGAALAWTRRRRPRLG